MIKIKTKLNIPFYVNSGRQVPAVAENKIRSVFLRLKCMVVDIIGQDLNLWQVYSADPTFPARGVSE